MREPENATCTAQGRRAAPGGIVKYDNPAALEEVGEETNGEKAIRLALRETDEVHKQPSCTMEGSAP